MNSILTGNPKTCSDCDMCVERVRGEYRCGANWNAIQFMSREYTKAGRHILCPIDRHELSQEELREKILNNLK